MSIEGECKQVVWGPGARRGFVFRWLAGLVAVWVLCAAAGCERKADPEPVSPSAAAGETTEADDKVITLAADVWLPYNGVPDSESPGFMIEIALYAFEHEGYEVEYLNVPWARAIHDTRRGIYDGIVGTGLEETPDFIFPEHELGLAMHTFFVNRDSAWRYQELASLEEISLGVIRDYSYGTLYDDYIKANLDDSSRVQAVGGEDALANNIAKLAAGRIDAMVEDRIVFDYHLFTTKTPNDFTIAGVYCEEKVYIAFSPMHPEAKRYAEILSDAVEELRASGKLAEILTRYGAEDWQ